MKYQILQLFIYLIVFQKKILYILTRWIFSRGFSGVCVEYANEVGKASLQPKLQVVLGVANNLTLDETTFPGDACMIYCRRRLMVTV